MELDLLRLSLLGIGVIVLLIIYWFNRPRSRSSPPPQSHTGVDPDEVLGIDRPITAVDEPLENEDLRSELESLKRAIVEPEDDNLSPVGPATAEPDRVGTALEADMYDEGPEAAEPESNDELPEDKIIVFYLVARSPDGLPGDRLFAAAESAGLCYGELRIYHHVREGEQQFGMANLVEPGYFEPDQADAFSTPGVTFFLQLPGPSQPLRAFDDMVRVAQTMASTLDADLRDGQRRTLGGPELSELRRDVESYEASPVS